jgi:ABC-type multidrug transport system ATPase subunit/ABC-type multidrug transport system permease subunit
LPLILLFLVGAQWVQSSAESVPQCDVDDKGLCAQLEAVSLLQNSFEVIKTSEEEELGRTIHKVHQWLDKERSRAEVMMGTGSWMSTKTPGVKEFTIIGLTVLGIMGWVWMIRGPSMGDNSKHTSDSIKEFNEEQSPIGAGPGCMEWTNLSLATGDKVILDSVSGSVKPGEMACILGPSGAGKTTLLNILAGRMNTQAPNMTFKGEISMGGIIVDPVVARSNIAYVMQEDHLPALSTPREILMMAALLRGKKDTQENLEAKVNMLLAELRLTNCEDTYVGNALVKGLSGGEKKRTSVAVELITAHNMILLDEPLSGLDSFAAWTVVEVLKDLASKGCAVLCTVHQPPSQVFRMFDKMICIADGKTVYCEAVTGLSGYMANLDIPVPKETNPADHILFHVQTQPTKSVSSLVASWAEQEKVQQLPDIDIVRATPEKKLPCGAALKSFDVQLRSLLQREIRLTLRNKVGLVLRFGVVAVMNLFFSSVFAGAGKEYQLTGTVTLDGLHGHFGALCSILITTMFGAAQPMLVLFPSERPIFLREYVTNTYSVIPYILAKTIVEVPLAFLTSLLAWLIVYWIVGFTGPLLVHVLISFILTLSTASAALFLGCAVTNAQSAQELSPLLLVPQVQFSGVFILISLIPAWLRWTQYLFPLKYAINLAAIVEFGGTELGRELLSQQEIGVEHTLLYALVLFDIFIGFRSLAAVILPRRAAFVV